MTDVNLERLLTYEEAAEILAWKRDQVRKACRQGRLPRVFLTPKTHRIDPIDLRAFIDQLKATGG